MPTGRSPSLRSSPPLPARRWPPSGPRGHTVQLGTGVFGGNARWRLTAHPQPKPKGASIPCVDAELGPSRPEIGGSVEGFGVCGSPSAENPIGFDISAGEGRQMRKVIVLAFPARATKVRIEFRGRSDQVLPMHSLTRYKQRRSHLPPFSWVVAPLSGPTCALRAVALDSRGAPINRPYDLHCS